MTIEGHIDRGSHGYGLRSYQDRERAFASAERHSQVVGILRKGLPILALLMLAGYFVSSGFTLTVGDVTASIGKIEVSNGNLRMVNPKLKGSDEKNGPYVISADYADQDMKNPKMMQLHAIKAEVTSPSGGWSRMQALRGAFNSQSEHLAMKEDIRLTTSSGVVGRLTYATLDMKNQTLRSHVPVAFDMTNGTVRANALTFQSSKNTLLFRGNVRVHLIKTKPDAPADASASAPQVKAPSGPARTPPGSDAPDSVTGQPR
jgi:lipopolysaccharide export system protein LptC